MDLSIITTEALQAELRRRNAEENAHLQKRNFIALAEEKNLTDEDIVLIAETFRDEPILWDIATAERKLNMKRASLLKMARKDGCPAIRKGNQWLFIASRMVDWLMLHCGEDVTA